MDLTDQRFGELLDAIAAKTPSPGGGAVASATGALGASLAAMVVQYSIGKKSLRDHEERHRAALGQIGNARAVLLRLAREDAEAYEEVNRLMKAPREDQESRQMFLATVAAATQAPMATIAACGDLLRLFEELAPISNQYLRSDLAIAAILAESAARASRWNVAVNASLLSQAAETATGRPSRAGDEALESADAMLRDAAALRTRVEAACRADG
ncbi:MAG: cyclodeaminase/cyclohydrolase family protein [Planctomycetota bacterium]|nr:cyclodeaminase/cyclohydrolase family protein [Planctomycetota bacterium]